MVNPDLAATAAALSPLRILVTGGSGFVGSHLARVLAAGGHDVTACGRNPYRVPFLPEGPTFERCDLTDRERVFELCSDRDLVYHAGALATPWGSAAAFSQVNVDGTRNIVDACLEHRVRRLVHLSSTAIQFDFKDATDVTEDASLADPFACHYARSKAEAEAIVREGIDRGLKGVIVRARAVFGPGDNSLLPRLLEAADRARLRQIGSRKTRIDLTYIDNLVLALLHAADRGDAGKTYTITNDEPVQLWPFIEEILLRTDRKPRLRTIPRSWALRLATLMELWHQWCGHSGEPALTRYTAGLLSTTKTFDITAAKKDLGYQPIVSFEQGTERVIDAWKRRDNAPANACVTVRMMSTGYTTAKAHHVQYGAPRNQTLRCHAMIALIEHPRHGLTLFDTGYSPRFFDATSRWPYRLYGRVTPVVTSVELSAASLLRNQGVDPRDVRRIVLSHFHADHTCGLSDFPNADIIATQACWDGVRGRRGLGAVKRAFLPSLMPSDLELRLFLIDHFHDAGFGPFEHGHDLFADGSVRMFDLSGHAPGQIGLLLQRGPTDRVLLAADAAWTSQSIRENLPPTLPFRLLADSTKAVLVTQQRLHELHRNAPDIELCPTHCPEVAARYKFDESVDAILASSSVDVGIAGQ